MTLLRRFAALPGYVRFLIAAAIVIPCAFLPSPIGWVAIAIVVILAVSTMILGPGRVVTD